ncbi:uncharacterized protein LOC124690879 [Lolium rigidum]|uniref:uncharacterized protein LOC124690879 n=1 Tax=Lolium rigidum TaxID=89674 RepID=UPI001F5C8B85|nr:uncharacterized protein LOC124690879 [Lolium rigidum]
MAALRLLPLLRRRRAIPNPSLLLHRRRPFSTSTSSPPPPSPANPGSSSPKPPSLSARLSFVFDQLDALDRSRSSDLSARDAALRRIQSWRRPPPPPPDAPPSPPPPEPREQVELEAAVATAGEQREAVAEVDRMSVAEVLRREVELVHPWPEWIELMERLAQQRYFDLGPAHEEARLAAAVPMDLSEVSEESGFDFSRDWTTVKNACMNFGRDRFDILKPLPRKDLQVLVGHGCPSMDPKVVFSAKLIRKLVHLDEGDVCSSCNLRNSCSRGYILTRKEDEARTLDVMRILLVYGFDHVKGTVENKSLLKLKSVKTVVRKLIHEIAKLSAVPIDPNLPPPVIRKLPPKVKQPPPPPKKRVGRDDVEMKKGDWLCPKCDFMNFAKNTICLQCDAKRPKRQLLPGEWECPRCDFLNYRRNMSCFHCEHDRPPDEYTNNQTEAYQSAPRKRSDRPARKPEVSSAWNFDFEDNESDGADVAAFEFADSSKGRESSSVDTSYRDNANGFEAEKFGMDETRSKGRERKFTERDSLNSSRVGFDDFDDEEDDIDSYELDLSKGGQTGGLSRVSYSDLDDASDSEDYGESSHSRNSNYGEKDDLTGSADDDEFVGQPSLKSSHIADSWQKTRGWSGSNNRRSASFGSESNDGAISDSDEDIDNGFRYKQGRNQGSRERVPDMDSDMDDQFQSDNRNRSSANFRDNFPARSSNLNSRSSNGDRYGRTKGNEQHFRRADFHEGGSANFRGNFPARSSNLNARSSTGDRYGRTKGNEQQFRRADVHDGGSFDKNHRGRANHQDHGSRGSQRNAGRNWDKRSEFDGSDRSPRHSNRR